MALPAPPLARRLALGVPKSAESGFERCLQYDVNFTELLQRGVRQADPSWPTVPCKSGWEFNHTEVPYDSIAAEVGPTRAPGALRSSETSFSKYRAGI